MSATPALQVRDVDQVFRSGFWLKRAIVLEGIELSVPSRSVFGFLGANGAGKTTLIQLIVGLRRPTRGSILIDGLDAASTEARSLVGFLPERPYFYEHLTGEGLLRYFGRLSGMKRGRIEERIPVVLDAVGMSAARKVELKRFSKGMLQRIGIAQAILHDPSFLVLDEPMSGLDPLGRKEIRELIVRLASGGKTVFFSSHVISDVEAICDQVAVIQRGRILGSGPISQLLAKGPLQTEIAFSDCALERARAVAEFVSFREIPGGFRGVVDEQAVTSALRGILESGGKVQSVNPVRPALEEIFAR